MSTRRTVVFAVLGGLAAIVMLGVGVFSFVWNITGPLVETAERHVQAMANGDIAAARDEFSLSLMDEVSADRLAEMAAGLNLGGDAEVSFSNRSISGGQGQLNGTVTGADGRVIPVRFTLVKERDAWRIIGFNYGG